MLLEPFWSISMKSWNCAFSSSYGELKFNFVFGLFLVVGRVSIQEISACICKEKYKEIETKNVFSCFIYLENNMRIWEYQRWKEQHRNENFRLSKTHRNEGENVSSSLHRSPFRYFVPVTPNFPYCDLFFSSHVFSIMSNLAFCLLRNGYHLKTDCGVSEFYLKSPKRNSQVSKDVPAPYWQIS